MAQKHQEKPKDIIRDAHLVAYWPDLDAWPERWHDAERDLAPVAHIVTAFKPFLINRQPLEMSRKTHNLHCDNPWLLGGEFIRALHETPKLGKRPAIARGKAPVDGSEGRKLHDHAYEQEQRSVNLTCKIFIDS